MPCNWPSVRSTSLWTKINILTPWCLGSPQTVQLRRVSARLLLARSGQLPSQQWRAHLGTILVNAHDSLCNYKLDQADYGLFRSLLCLLNYLKGKCRTSDVQATIDWWGNDRTSLHVVNHSVTCSSYCKAKGPHMRFHYLTFVFQYIIMKSLVILITILTIKDKLLKDLLIVRG